MKSDMQLVPVNPTEEQWSGLARSIVMWWCMNSPTGAALFRHLGRYGEEIPQWLRDEIPDVERVPPMGTVAAIIYKAMIADAQQASAERVRYPTWKEIEAAVPGLITRTAALAVAKFAIDFSNQHTVAKFSEDTAALALLSKMRMACGDNGLRMQDELEEYLKELAVNDRRWRKLCAMLDVDDGAEVFFTIPLKPGHGTHGYVDSAGLTVGVDTAIQEQG